MFHFFLCASHKGLVFCELENLISGLSTIISSLCVCVCVHVCVCSTIISAECVCVQASLHDYMGTGCASRNLLIL